MQDMCNRDQQMSWILQYLFDVCVCICSDLMKNKTYSDQSVPDFC